MERCCWVIVLYLRPWQGLRQAGWVLPAGAVALGVTGGRRWACRSPKTQGLASSGPCVLCPVGRVGCGGCRARGDAAEVPAPEALGSGDTSPPGEEPVSEANCLQDRDTHAMGGTASGPPAQPWQEVGGGAPGPAPRGQLRGAARAQSSSSSFAVAVRTRSCTLKQPTKKLITDRYRCCLSGALWR